ncbi:MAG: formylglycine-generating enzyme family protein [Rhizobium sp.]|nr:MAG: formylglycine-generating enzyme family protein [Rhizobium sp.]
MRLRSLFILTLLLMCPMTVMASGKSMACVSDKKTLPNGTVIFRDCLDGPEMIALSGGRFRMGDLVGDGKPYELPVHDVQIAAFAIGRFEVTNAEWQACVKDGGCSASRIPGDAQHGRYPVAGITWAQAKSYSSWLAARSGKPYRLLSEAEWEYAARSGNEGRYYWGSFDPSPCNYSNLMDASGKRANPESYWAERCDDGFAGAAPVGSFPPNAWGLYDMLGNVWEWVGDCWHADYSNAPNDGSVWSADLCRKHVNRGGGWGNNANSLRLSSRDADLNDASSDGLGFRVARSLSAGELQQLAGTPPDKRPALPGPTLLTKAQRKQAEAAAKTGTSTTPRTPSSTGAGIATSLALERQMDVHITVKGEQSWKNVLQHTQGSTQQDYVLSTRLRSDGILYGENLLDPNTTKRLSIKQQYLARHGLIRLKQQNGGRLPRTAEEIAALDKKQKDCGLDDRCIGETVERLAAITALQNNSVDDLEALIAAPATGDAARWLYFFGYAGCPNRIAISSETHISGERAYNHAKTSLVPWSLDRSANSNGSAEDRSTLCQRYTATIDVRSGDVYLENLYIPSPMGSSRLRRNKTIEQENIELPVAAEMLIWANERLRRSKESAEFTASLPANMPFDGDSTVLGTFTGKLDVTMTWSFKPVDGAPQASIP